MRLHRVLPFERVRTQARSGSSVPGRQLLSGRTELRGRRVLRERVRGRDERLPGLQQSRPARSLPPAAGEHRVSRLGRRVRPPGHLQWDGDNLRRCEAGVRYGLRRRRHRVHVRPVRWLEQHLPAPEQAAWRRVHGRRQRLHQGRVQRGSLQPSCRQRRCAVPSGKRPGLRRCRHLHGCEHGLPGQQARRGYGLRGRRKRLHGRHLQWRQRPLPASEPGRRHTLRQRFESLYRRRLPVRHVHQYARQRR